MFVILEGAAIGFAVNLTNRLFAYHSLKLTTPSIGTRGNAVFAVQSPL